MRIAGYELVNEGRTSSVYQLAHIFGHTQSYQNEQPTFVSVSQALAQSRFT